MNRADQVIDILRKSMVFNLRKSARNSSF